MTLTTAAPALQSIPAAANRAVILIDDHPVTRLGLKAIIEQQPDLQVVAEADNAPQAVQLITRHRPDVAVVDVSLKTTNGIELAKNLGAVVHGLPILMLSMHSEEMYAERALRAGARGYLMKQAACEQLVPALRKVLAGEVYVSEHVHRRMLQTLVHKGGHADGFAIDTLSDREMEVFRLIGDGYATREIALRLNLSPKTIDSYREHLKLKLKSGSALLQHAIEWARGASLG